MILIGHFLLAIVYSLVIPPWEAHDEWAHFRYAAYIAETRSLPDPNVRLTTEFRFDEASQPPLYYVLAALPMFVVDTADGYSPAVNPYATRGTGEGGVNLVLHDAEAEGWPWQGTMLALHLGRLVSTLLSMIALYITYLLVRLLSPDEPEIALVATGIQAFAPQFVFLSAVITNDILLILLETLFLYLCIRMVLEGPAPRRVLFLAIVAGLSLLTKYLALAVLPLAVIAVLLGAWIHRKRSRQYRQSVLSLIVLAIIILAMGGIFVGRNVMLTGTMFPRDLTSQQAIVSSFLGVQELSLDWTVIPDALTYGFETYWVSFGWGNVGAPPWVYVLWFIVLLIGLVGTFLWISKDMPARLRPALVIILLFVGAVISFPLLRELIHQSSFLRGRYILATLPVVSWIIAQGWAKLSGRAWIWVRHGLVLGPAVLTVALIPFLIIPSYAMPTTKQAMPSDTSQMINARFGDVAELMAVDIGAIDAVNVGEGVAVTLTWKVLQRTDVPYTLSLHVVGAGDESYGNTTSFPGHGKAATTMWLPGTEFTETYWVKVEDQGPVPALGKVAITLSSKEAEHTYLPVFDSMGHRVGNTVRVGQFRIDRSDVSATAAAPTNSDQYLARFDDLLLLTDVGMPQITQQPGWAVPVLLRWRALAASTTEIKLAVQLLDSEGNWIAGSDRDPSETLPPQLWRPGDVLHATTWLPLPADLLPGEYTVIATLYRPDDLTRLTGSDILGNPLEANAWTLGKINVVAPDTND